MKSKLFTTSIFLCSILFLFAGCDKDDEEVTPPSFQEIKLNMEDMRFSDMPNLATITGYSGIDPEVSLSGLTPGVDNKNRYPSTRTYTFGVSIKF